MVDFDARIVVLALRIAQAILTVVVLGLSAYVASWWNNFWVTMSPGQVNFIIFDSVWTLLALAYLVVVPWRFSDTKAHHKFVILGVEALTMLFWFAGFVALAVFLTGRRCDGSVCSAAEASTVFAAFEWVLFAATTAMAVMHVLRTRNRSSDDGKADPNLNVQQTAQEGV